MVFNSYNKFCLFSLFYNGSTIKRFNYRSMEYLYRISLSLQNFSGFNNFSKRFSVSYYSNVSAFFNNFYFAKIKFIAVIKNITEICSCNSYIHRSVVVCCKFYYFFTLFAVRRNNYRHIRNISHKGNILKCLMACSIFSYSNSSMCTDNFYVKFRITD